MDHQYAPFSDIAAPPATAKVRSPKKGMAVTALVLGIVALCGSPIPILNNATIIAGFIGVVFGIVGLFGTHRAMTITGLGLAVAGIAIGIALQIQWAHQLDQLKTNLDNSLNDVQSSLANIPPPTFPVFPTR